MKRNIFLLFGVLALILLGFNSFKRIMDFRATGQKVEAAEDRLERLRKEKESLEAELRYKSSQEFAEGEIRDKLGLAKPNEAIIILPKDESKETDSNSEKAEPNWQKWWNLFFRG